MNPKTIESILDEIEERANAVTSEPWHGHDNPIDEHWASLHPEDETFIAYSRTDVPRLTKALRLAVELINKNAYPDQLERLNEIDPRVKKRQKFKDALTQILKIMGGGDD